MCLFIYFWSHFSKSCPKNFLRDNLLKKYRAPGPLAPPPGETNAFILFFWPHFTKSYPNIFFFSLKVSTELWDLWVCWIMTRSGSKICLFASTPFLLYVFLHSTFSFHFTSSFYPFTFLFISLTPGFISIYIHTWTWTPLSCFYFTDWEYICLQKVCYISYKCQSPKNHSPKLIEFLSPWFCLHPTQCSSSSLLITIGFHLEPRGYQLLIGMKKGNWLKVVDEAGATLGEDMVDEEFLLSY